MSVLVFYFFNQLIFPPNYLLVHIIGKYSAYFHLCIIRYRDANNYEYQYIIINFSC